MPYTTRRALISVAATAPIAAALPAQAHDGSAENDAYTYEVQRTEEEWRERLTEEEYRLLRENGTEERFSSEYAAGHQNGHFHCKGCDLVLYEGAHKEILPIGWVFFRHAVPDSILMGIDAGPQANGAEAMGEGPFFIEAHCRRCGSHMGHIVPIDNTIYHCINGNCLTHSGAES